VSVSARVSRLPLRVRLVVGFSATMLLVLAAAGAFVYWRVSFALDRQVNDDLTEISDRVAPLVTPSGTLEADASPLTANETYQVLDRRGQVLSSSTALGLTPLLPPEVAVEALSAPVRRDIGRLLPINNHPLRAYATALPRNQAAAILVVAVRRDHRDEALLELLAQLAVAGFGALLVTAVVGERLARLAMRPVERYRAQAESIVSGETGVRLDVPADRDDEVTRLGHTLNATLDALEDALDTERRFVNDASHELRTPLTLLKARVQLTRRRTRTVPEHEAVLAEIDTDLLRLTQLAEQLLQVGEPTGGTSGSEVTDLALATEAAVALREELSRDAEQEPGGWAVSTAGPAPVGLPSTKIDQVVGNLLDNAARHGDQPIVVRVDTVNGVRRLVVADQGAGMDPVMLAVATHRFSRSDASRSQTGFGLGLSLVESIVASAGGELRLCHAGTHQGFGTPLAVDCDHETAMTVTVLLPGAS